MSRVFQNIDPHPPLRPPSVSSPRECVPLPLLGGGGHTRQGEKGVGGQYILEHEGHSIALLHFKELGKILGKNSYAE
jgi:hypothetical protein